MESPTPVSRYIPQNSKKRVFPGGSSNGCKEADVVEIPPPINRTSKAKLLKQKEVICHEIIDVDMDEDCDVMLIDGQVDTSCKGKEALSNFSLGPSSMATGGSGDGLQLSNSGSAGLHNSINVDDFNSSLFYGEDECIDMYYDDLIEEDYAILQSHFDHMDIPPGIEAPLPWLPSSAGSNMKLMTPSTSTNSSSQLQLDGASLPPDTNLVHPPSQLKTVQIKDQSTSHNSSQLGTLVHTVSQPVELNLSPTMWEPPLDQDKLTTSSSTAYPISEIPSSLLNLKHGKDSLRSSGKSRRKSHAPHALYGSNSQLPASPKKFFSSVKTQVDSSGNYPKLNPVNTPGAGTFVPVPLWKKWNMNMLEPCLLHPGFISGSSSAPWGHDPATNQNNALSAATPEPPTNVVHRNEDEILQNFNHFKQFDTVEDYSDHHYSKNGSSMKQPSKNWTKRIQEEWKILEKDLPDTIFVRVYESRMDLLRTVIVGAEGTPYHDGLFFFDVFFPGSYPNVPPLVHYHSGGLRINPNLYNCGKVCLSLLNTWSGSQKEKWIPGVSTMLQVLVSIQGLILNAKPYFNEPGYANMSGSASGERCSLVYNEKTFIFSLQTMVYSMRRPPKYFEDFVVGHFCKRSRDILVACKAYMEGAQVGCLVKGGVQDVDEGDKSCSQDFKSNLAGFITTLVNAFSQIGAKDCLEFLCLAQKANGQVSPAPGVQNSTSNDHHAIRKWSRFAWGLGSSWGSRGASWTTPCHGKGGWGVARRTIRLDSFTLMAQQFMATQGHGMHDPWAAGQDQDNIETLSSEAEVAVDIPEFQGSLEADDFLDWLGAVEEILEFKDVWADKLVSLVATRFRGRAAAWWQQLKASRVRAASISEAHQRALQAERQHNRRLAAITSAGTLNTTTTPVANARQQSGRGPIPAGYASTPPITGRGGGGLHCYNCGAPGHRRNECPSHSDKTGLLAR
ncbi:putative ubiquitin-conjugating enzyme E2 26 [Abeliophyllum distichum]|uniref:E2 ubiquitin-conjugating enzyme n=1 Tax=Abeliophyllum distichum TaxID=126358 RepID=A0ABD1QJD5_9LAMI